MSGSEPTTHASSAGVDVPDSSVELLPQVYAELRRLAAYRLAQEKPGQTLQATALVHEAYLRLIQAEGQRFENRAHFFSAAAEAMRRIVIGNARRKQRLRHGGGFERVELTEVGLAIEPPSEDLLALDEALEELSRDDPQSAELIKLRFFAGLTQQQAAEVLGISRRTANSTWLFRRLRPESKSPKALPTSGRSGA